MRYLYYDAQQLGIDCEAMDIDTCAVLNSIFPILLKSRKAKKKKRKKKIAKVEPKLSPGEKTHGTLAGRRLSIIFTRLRS